MSLQYPQTGCEIIKYQNELFLLQTKPFAPFFRKKYLDSTEYYFQKYDVLSFRKDEWFLNKPFIFPAGENIVFLSQSNDSSKHNFMLLQIPGIMTNALLDKISENTIIFYPKPASLYLGFVWKYIICGRFYDADPLC